MFHIKYPYTIGILLVVWAGSATLYAIDTNLPVVYMVIVNSLITLYLINSSMR